MHARRLVRLHEGGMPVPRCASRYAASPPSPCTVVGQLTGGLGDTRAEKDLFKRTKVEIVGVSGDAADKQKEFVEKQKLTVRAMHPIVSIASWLSEGTPRLLL